MPDISTLPIWAQAIIYVVIGVGLLIAVLVGRSGLLAGIKGSDANSSKAQVAAVIVDPSALNRATAAIEGFNVTATEANMIGRQRVETERALVDKIDRLTGAIGDLKDEVIRGAGKMK